MTKEIIKVGSDGIQLQDFNSMQRFCAAAVESRMFNGVVDVSQAIMKVEYGMELGVKPITAMRGIHYFQGTFSLSASLINALIKRAGYNFTTVERSLDRCLLRFESPGGKPLGDSEFTWSDAATKNLTTKKNWREHPKNMLFARALTQGATMYCAEVFLGPVYTPEEIMESTSSTDYIPPEAPPMERLVNESETISGAVVDIKPEPEPPTRSPVVEVLEASSLEVKGHGSNGVTKPNGDVSKSAASIMKSFMLAIDTCVDVEELDETMDAWQEHIEDLPRGKSNCLAYFRVAVAAAQGEEADKDSKSEAEKLSILKQK